MINPRITYPTPEGGVAIIIPAPDCGLTIEQIAAKDVPTGVPFKIVEADSIPSDRTFRNAWEHCQVNGAKVSIPKAKAVKLDQFRLERAPKLAALDVSFVRALEQGDTAAQASIASEKQALRDVTKVTLPDDLSALKDFKPDILK
jgi:hypothetical protein